MFILVKCSELTCFYSAVRAKKGLNEVHL